jgi:hypothetical protein
VETKREIADHDEIDIAPFMHLTPGKGTVENDPVDTVPLTERAGKLLKLGFYFCIQRCTASRIKPAE